MTSVFLAVEDELSEAVGKRLISVHWSAETQITTMRKNGAGYLYKNIGKFCELARRNVVILITDLDQHRCAPSFIRKWMKTKAAPERLIFRVAVREIESWVLADRRGLSNYLGIAHHRLPQNPDALRDPKSELIQLSRRAKRGLRDAIVPEPGVAAKQGLGYNKALTPFVEMHWSIAQAEIESDSLRRANAQVRAAWGEANAL